MFSGLEGMEGICLWGLKEWRVYVCGVWRLLIDRGTFVGL
jgi:hypothetical protein